MKIKKTLGLCGAAALSAAFLLALAPASRAATFNYTVTLNVASLIPDLNGPYALDLQLVDGSGNVSNSVTITNFVVVGGSFTGAPVYTNGTESGSTASAVVLTNSSSDSEYAQIFSAATTQIRFFVTETNNQETVGTGTPVPDQFNIAILDTNLNNITTTAPSGDVLVSHAMEGTQGASQIESFSSDGRDGNGGVTAIPEPGSTAMLCIGGGLLAFWIRRRASSSSRVCA